MAFDGITTAHIVSELRSKLIGGGINRVIQPEKDELYLTIKNNKETFQLYMSANASLPLLYLSEKKPAAPLSAPNFCMLLRKHIQGGRISDIIQPSLERAVTFVIDHRDEMGDPCQKKLVVEIMGKYSNIILLNADDTVMDSIKRVPATMSSVREVLPGRAYFLPQTQEKQDPLTLTEESATVIFNKPLKVSEAIFKSLTGISPLMAEEFCYEAGIDGGLSCAALSENQKESLSNVLLSRMTDIKSGVFSAQIVLQNGVPKDFASLPLLMYGDTDSETFDSPSQMLLGFYDRKNKETRMREKSAGLRHQVTTALDRVNKKAVIQEKQLKDAEKKDKYKLYGELLNAFGYSAEPEAKTITVTDYYTNEPVTIPLDPTLTASVNAQKYYERYNKLKRTEAQVTEQLSATYRDRELLESILEAIDKAENDADLNAIRDELIRDGWVKRRIQARGKVREEKSKPMFFRSSDGFLIAVGKNNIQNDELTFKYASGNDWWFHAKGQPGSHVILKTEGKDIPDRAFEEAASLAAHFSKGKKAPKVEIDYTLRKHVKKTPAGNPGFVIYHTNYSLMAVPDISQLTREQ